MFLHLKNPTGKGCVISLHRHMKQRAWCLFCISVRYWNCFLLKLLCICTSGTECKIHYAWYLYTKRLLACICLSTAWTLRFCSPNGNVCDTNFTVHWSLLQVHFSAELKKIKLQTHLGLIKTRHLANLKIMRSQWVFRKYSQHLILDTELDF